jgi:hypothetical protein
VAGVRTIYDRLVLGKSGSAGGERVRRMLIGIPEQKVRLGSGTFGQTGSFSPGRTALDVRAAHERGSEVIETVRNVGYCMAS